MLEMRSKTNLAWRKKIIHIDMDAFFAAVEQRDHPEYRGKPLVVGGDPFGRGVVSTCSYEARKFGIRSAMPAAQARRMCPQAVFVRPDFEKYEEVSKIVMAILRKHTELTEQVSLDEAYLDVTSHRFGIEDPVMIACMLKQSIFAVTRLTASAGVAPNLYLAKMASDFEKPDGLTVVPPGEAMEFLKDLPVRKIPGVGPVTEKQLHEMNVKTCGELAGLEPLALYQRFGKTGLFLCDRAHGEDDSEVVPDAPAKQCSVEETFPCDIKDVEWLKMKLLEYAGQVFSELQAKGRIGRTVVLKVKYHDFESITRSKTLPVYPALREEIYETALRLLLTKTQAGEKPVRLLGIGISGLQDTESKVRPNQQELFV
jgi:DNA polymerase-4